MFKKKQFILFLKNEAHEVKLFILFVENRAPTICNSFNGENNTAFSYKFQVY